MRELPSMLLVLQLFSSFEEIVSKENGVPRESAVRWLRAMVRAGKYHVEAGS